MVNSRIKALCQTVYDTQFSHTIESVQASMLLPLCVHSLHTASMFKFPLSGLLAVIIMVSSLSSAIWLDCMYQI